jgi:putative membrane protein
MHWWYVDGWGWGGWLISTVMMLVFVGAVALVVVALVRQPGGGRPEDPERILADRFARGEIDEDEYKRRRYALRG